MSSDRPIAAVQQSLDIIVPVYNEGASIVDLHSKLREVCQGLDYTVRYLFVDDGSTDTTTDHLAELSERHASVAVIELARNFGHQAALTAGLDHCHADAVITMDADGQHPPELIPEMLKLMEAGIELVITQRIGDRASPWHRRWSSALFYRVINILSRTRIQAGGADFRLMTREVVSALTGMREYHRFLRGMTAWLGFRTATLPYTATPRSQGRSKYSLAKQLKLAQDAAFSFSLVPLYGAILLGAIFILLAIAEAVYVSAFWLAGRADQLVPGWSSLMFILLCVGGTLAILLGIVGIYTGYIFQEVKRRPVYVVRRVVGDTKARGAAASNSGNPN